MTDFASCVMWNDCYDCFLALCEMTAWFRILYHVKWLFSHLVLHVKTVLASTTWNDCCSISHCVLWLFQHLVLRVMTLFSSCFTWNDCFSILYYVIIWPFLHLVLREMTVLASCITRNDSFCILYYMIWLFYHLLLREMTHFRIFYILQDVITGSAAWWLRF
jgi:hypothetical protein